jgi:murein DD-endopeptidase MepM/ murein hydrolase activator NlpD
MATIPVVGARIPRPHPLAEGVQGGWWLAPRSQGHRLHAGVDLHAAHGASVLAPESGVVVVAARASYADEVPRHSAPPGWSGYGPGCVVLHGDSGWYHVLAHVAPVGARAIQTYRVAEGDRIASASAVGHVHWEVRAALHPPGDAATVEVCCNPASWLAASPMMWQGQCPDVPTDDTHTPRQCRPGWRGPAPRPFPHPRSQTPTRAR